MKKSVIFFLILIIISGSICPFSFNLIKVVNLLTKISTKITQYSDKIDDHYEEFINFYKEKWAKYYTKFSLIELDVFDTWEMDQIYDGQNVDSDDMGTKWENIFKDPEKLKKEFPNLFYTSHYKDNPEYISNANFKKNTDENINDGIEYLVKIESLITLLRNTRESQKLRGKKVVELKKYIKNFSRPKGRDEVRMGRLIGLEVIIDYEIEKQMIELISLVNAQTEIRIRSSLMDENMSNRNHASRMRINNAGLRSDKRK